MKIAGATDNRNGIAFGGAALVCKLPHCDIQQISIGDSEAVLAVPRRSYVPKEWKFPSESQLENSIVEACGGSAILAKLLAKRGLTQTADIESYLDPTKYVPSSAMELLDMTKAVSRITQAVVNKEKITIYGDYDVDGVTATAVMVTTLRYLGADVDYYIPTRAEGYGLNLKAVSVLASKHRTKLLITCDCGVSNFSEINFARSLGVDTVVVDHHSMPELLPPAVAILHPKQLSEDHPLYHLPGVGVAFKLAEALLEDKGEPERAEQLLDLVTLGMIADMVPLVKECRYLVQIGMPKLVGSERVGIKALLGQVGARDGGTELVGFGLAPRINAVGRLSDANTAVKLMITDDEAEAAELARQLEYENVRRQELCEEIFAKADQAAQRNLQAGDRAIAVYGEGWHHGVVGIVASRLVDKYHCPTFVAELDPSEGIVKGSARGVDGIDLFEALKANEHLALKCGGHKMAAGFSVEAAKAELFFTALVQTCNRMLAEKPMNPTLDVDLVMDASEVTMDLASLITRMAPFGIGNKKPVFALRETKCTGSRALGKEGKHSRIAIQAESGEQFECVYWNSQGRVPQDLQQVDVAFAPDINHYNGVSRLQLILNDWRDPRQPMPAPVVVPAAKDAAVEPNQGAERGHPVRTVAADMSPPRSEENTESGRGRPRAQADAERPHSQADAAPAPGTIIDASPTPSVLTIKDLRTNSSPDGVLQAAVRKLGDKINIYGEASPGVPNVPFNDRTAIQPTGHLLLWQYPPALPVLKSLIQRSNATTLYLLGGAQPPSDDASNFLKRLLGIVRFAINQREGQADPEKMAAAMSATKMTIALGLTILKKINLIDWFAEDGCIYLDLLGEPSDKPERQPEFRQLGNCLREIGEFRSWCHTATISEIQLALVPAPDSSQQNMAPIRDPQPAMSDPDQETGIYTNDTASELSSNFS